MKQVSCAQRDGFTISLEVKENDMSLLSYSDNFLPFRYKRRKNKKKVIISWHRQIGNYIITVTITISVLFFLQIISFSKYFLPFPSPFFFFSASQLFSFPNNFHPFPSPWLGLSLTRSTCHFFF